MSAFIWHLFVECPVENMVLYYEEDITFTFTGNDSYVLIYSSENKSLACDDMNQKNKLWICKLHFTVNFFSIYHHNDILSTK